MAGAEPGTRENSTWLHGAVRLGARCPGAWASCLGQGDPVDSWLRRGHGPEDLLETSLPLVEDQVCGYRLHLSVQSGSR